MSPLAPKQQEVLDFILSHRKNHQTLPTKQEIRYGMEFKNYNSVVVIMGALKKKGYIEDSLTSVGYRLTHINNDNQEKMDQHHKEVGSEVYKITTGGTGDFDPILPIRKASR